MPAPQMLKYSLLPLCSCLALKPLPEMLEGDDRDIYGEENILYGKSAEEKCLEETKPTKKRRKASRMKSGIFMKQFSNRENYSQKALFWKMKITLLSTEVRR